MGVHGAHGFSTVCVARSCRTRFLLSGRPAPIPRRTDPPRPQNSATPHRGVPPPIPQYGLPSFATLGLPHGAVKEGRERVNAAITNSGLEFPLTKPFELDELLKLVRQLLDDGD